MLALLIQASPQRRVLFEERRGPVAVLLLPAEGAEQPIQGAFAAVLDRLRVEVQRLLEVFLDGLVVRGDGAVREVLNDLLTARRRLCRVNVELLVLAVDVAVPLIRKERVLPAGAGAERSASMSSATSWILAVTSSGRSVTAMSSLRMELLSRP